MAARGWQPMATVVARPWTCALRTRCSCRCRADISTCQSTTRSISMHGGVKGCGRHRCVKVHSCETAAKAGACSAAGRANCSRAPRECSCIVVPEPDCSPGAALPPCRHAGGHAASFRMHEPPRAHAAPCGGTWLCPAPVNASQVHRAAPPAVARRAITNVTGECMHAAEGWHRTHMRHHTRQRHQPHARTACHVAVPPPCISHRLVTQRP